MKKNNWRILAVLFNCILILIFLAICLVPFFSSGISWLLSTFGLIFPFLLGLIFIMLILWVFRAKRKIAIVMIVLNLIVLALGYTQIRASVGLHFFAEKDVNGRLGDIRVMSWNVSSWDINNWDIKNHQTYQPMMFDLIQQLNPDVLLLQEFFNCSEPKIVVSYLKLLSERGYPYYYFSPQSVTINGAFQSGLAIFSRYPISDTAFFYPESAGHSEGFQYADITIRDKKYRFFNAHLESAGLNRDDVQAIGKVKGSRTIFYKLKNSHQVRERQSHVLKQKMNVSPHPVIFGGDVDDVPNTSVYFFLRNGLQDAFIEKGSGLGRTFRLIAPNLRIDYLFFSKQFTINQFFTLKNDYSVHYPIVADFSE